MTEHDRTDDQASTPEAAAPDHHRPAAPEEPAAIAEHPRPVDQPEPVHPSAPTVAAPPAPAEQPQPERIVYVPAPQPPRRRGSRRLGVGVALASSLVFTILYAVLATLFIFIGLGAGGPGLAQQVQAFASTPSFWMPVIAFAVGYVVLVLIVNRAGWWAHVLGGFLVAALVYVVFIGSTVLSAEATGASPADLQRFLLLQITNPLGWSAAIAAREVPIWVGGLVARNGRAAKARNAEARAEYERELAAARAGAPREGAPTPAV
ncbi:hypothetical protein [Yonghaparkia sp. Soil809]|uniref:hypothetical protein n=1 Tax=Yonghaparkia sp. Soil809 TaxID=1736417 RepID=UPI0006F691FC|nr:hypothetical protein [Yonghaparkia sp. Soil809]KRF33091.1 hypothetical protein ASG83_03640 [Yonghaparkia sp. Soil809]